MSKSKINKTGRSEKVPRGFVILDGYMLDSEAWKSLNPIARAVYIALKRRHRNRSNGKSNNGYISMSRREAAQATGFSESAMRNAFPELIDKGFIKITRESSFNMKDTRAREYALTELPVGDNLSTKEFLRWPQIQNTGARMTPVGCADDTREINSSSPKAYSMRSTGARMTPVKGTHGCADGTTINYHRGRGSEGMEKTEKPAIINFGLSEIPFFLTGIESGVRRTG